MRSLIRIFTGRITKDAKFLHVYKEGSADQTAQMRRLIGVFLGRTCPKINFLILLIGYSRYSFTELFGVIDYIDDITKTYIYNFGLLKPHFYIIKLEFTGVYIIFFISAQNIDCGYSLEPPRRGGSKEYLQSMS